MMVRSTELLSISMRPSDGLKPAGILTVLDIRRLRI
jgi:hypothetical protein